MNNKSPSEHAEQVAFVQRCKRENIFVFAIPNGVNLSDSKKRFAEIEKLKTEGLVKGIPDLFIPEYKLFIEMKRRDGGVVSESQKKVHKILRGFGYKVEVAHGAQKAWQTVEKIRNCRKDKITDNCSNCGYQKECDNFDVQEATYYDNR